jgi:hypothetical protein
MGQLRTTNKRHKRAVAKLLVEKADAPAPVETAKAAA